MSKNSAPPLAVLYGCAGTELTGEERGFFARHNPLGFILFARNIASPQQTRALVTQLREAVGREDAPVLIDQEGGRVQRLRPPHWRKAPPGAVFNALADRDLALAEQALRLNFRLIAAELHDLGIDVDCAPVLDVPVPGAHDVIGDRAYGGCPGRVARLGRAACQGLLDGGVTPIIKHIPGHGRATVDSHLHLPVVETSLDELRRMDFAPFRALADMGWAMTAHVVYRALDPETPATTSKRVIHDIIRGEINFDGVLVSDDLSMKALAGDFGQRAQASLGAGCDLVLHCNGNMAEMLAVARGALPLSDASLARLARANAQRGHPEGLDIEAALRQLDAWLAPAV